MEKFSEADLSEGDDYLRQRKPDILHFIPVPNHKLRNKKALYHRKQKILIPEIFKNIYPSLTEKEFLNLFRTQQFLTKSAKVCCDCYLLITGDLEVAGKRIEPEIECLYQKPKISVNDWNSKLKV